MELSQTTISTQLLGDLILSPCGFLLSGFCWCLCSFLINVNKIRSKYFSYSAYLVNFIKKVPFLACCELINKQNETKQKSNKSVFPSIKIMEMCTLFLFSYFHVDWTGQDRPKLYLLLLYCIIFFSCFSSTK